MNILNFLDKLSTVNTEDSQKQSRWASLTELGLTGTTIAAAAIPAAILSGIPFGVASAKGAHSTATVVDVLNFALTLEYLEAEFYSTAVNQAFSNIPSNDLPIFQQISKHETAHVAFLKSTISSLGGTAVSKPNFDFTVNGKFNPFGGGGYGDFLALSQAFEDTGVRAYKGQAGNLTSNKAVLTAALQIHSVEARHASEVRRLRTKNGMDTSKGWITLNSRGSLPVETQATYDGEESTTQGGLAASSFTTVSINAVSEAFDEPLTMEQTLAIANLFIA